MQDSSYPRIFKNARVAMLSYCNSEFISLRERIKSRRLFLLAVFVKIQPR